MTDKIFYVDVHNKADDIIIIIIISCDFARAKPQAVNNPTNLGDGL